MALFLVYNGYLNDINVIRCYNVGPGTKLHFTITVRSPFSYCFYKKGKLTGMWSGVNEAMYIKDFAESLASESFPSNTSQIP